MSASEEECPVCRGKIINPSQPSPCCGKVFCQRCLNQSFRFRTHCPYCRSSVSANNSLPPSRRLLRQILPGNFDAFNSRAPVGSNIHALISRLEDSQAQQTNTGAQVSLPNQATLAPAPQNRACPLLIPAARPVPMPRIRVQPANVATLNAARVGLFQVAQRPAPTPLLPNPVPLHSNPVPLLPNPVPLLPNPVPLHSNPVPLHSNPVPLLPNPVPLHSNPVPLLPNPVPLLPNPVPLLPNPVPLLPNPAPPRQDLQAMLDDWPWQTEITLMENNNHRPQSLTVRTFVCPYCRDNGLDELDLRDHCNDRHANDSRRVVCPVCVATPHGDPQYYSRDFVAHLNLRHCYYMDDITNLHQTDEMNLQCAILASYMKNV